MDKVKIRMEYSNFVAIAHFMNSINTNSNIASEQISNCLLKELHRDIWNLVYKNYMIDHSKVISKKITHSYALNFFYCFNGHDYSNLYSKVAVKQMCNQIEQQLFVTGKYSFPI